MKTLPLVLIILLQASLFAQNPNYQDLVEGYNSSERDTNRIKWIMNLMDVLHFSSEDSCIMYLNEALELSEELNEPVFQARTLRYFGAVYQYTGKYENSIDYY